ncbi:MAG: Fic family protein [Candidatus Omnitrophota bacterium]
MKYIHELDIWPTFTWDHEKITSILGPVRNRQGRLIGRMETLGFSLRSEAVLQTLTLDVLKSSEIEGEVLDPAKVRSSIARRLGMDIGGLVPSDRHVDGVVEMMLDATQNFDKPLTQDRMFGWQAGLFPTGHSGMHKITVGAWRDDRHGPMRVVSGPVGREKVHYEAPEAGRLKSETKEFLAWFNGSARPAQGRRPSLTTGGSKDLDPVLKAGIAHLWFVTLHPFDDGNGRIARAIADMQLARADGSRERFYSMSNHIRQERNAYYDILEKTQKSIHAAKDGIDITAWLVWFLNCLGRALDTTETTLSGVFKKVRFWDSLPAGSINERQKTMINKLFDSFEGKLTTSKWAKITKCSQDTAHRDILDLVGKGVLVKDPAGGRSTSYSLKEDSGLNQ